MHAYFLAFVWGIAVLASMLGWGFSLLRVLRFEAKSDFGWQAALGVAFSVAVGGFLNIIHAVSRHSVLIYLLLGWVLFLICVIWQGKNLFRALVDFFCQVKTRKLLLVLVGLIMAILFVRYASSVAFFGFHGTDDQNGYMVFPAKMLQTGSLGNDPYSERRIVSALGGKYFLDTFILAGADFKNLHLMDNGIGLLLFLLVLIGFLEDNKLSLDLSLWVLLAAVVVPSPSGNVTAFYTASILFMALFRLLVGQKELSRRPWASLVFLALLASALCVLKSNLIFSGVILFLAYFVLRIKSGLKLSRAAGELCLATVLVLLFMLPWMLSMKQSSGTLLYPFLGIGYEGSRYGSFLSPYLEFNLYGLIRLIWELIYGLSLFIPFFILVFVWLKQPAGWRKNSVLLMFTGALAGMLAMIYGIGGYSLYYYTFPFFFPAILGSAALLLEQNQSLSLKPEILKGLPVAFCVLLFIFGAYVQQDVEIIQAAKDDLNVDGGLKIGLVNSPLVPPDELKQYAALQQAVPAGQPILARLDRNFLFDFRRNPIYIIDLPGGASLPPGMPSFKGSEPLAEYFLSKGVKYVAYSYGNEANYTRAIDGSMLRPHVNPLLRTEAQHTFDFQDNLMELYKTRKVIYDDGKNFVLDLSQKP